LIFKEWMASDGSELAPTTDVKITSPYALRTIRIPYAITSTFSSVPFKELQWASIFAQVGGGGYHWKPAGWVKPTPSSLVFLKRKTTFICHSIMCGTSSIPTIFSSILSSKKNYSLGYSFPGFSYPEFACGYLWYPDQHAAFKL
jgi:hypothetical protein